MKKTMIRLYSRQRKRKLIQKNRIIDKILDGSTVPLRYFPLALHFTGKSFEICAKQAGVEVCGAKG